MTVDVIITVGLAVCMSGLIVAEATSPPEEQPPTTLEARRHEVSLLYGTAQAVLLALGTAIVGLFVLAVWA